ncbi:hypothetical protein [Sphingomonas sp.]|uniref:hypothetical protein n=1 Tax=Sphingomonas sp. TaxID=28214 RepID=UPI0035C83A43
MRLHYAAAILVLAAPLAACSNAAEDSAVAFVKAADEGRTAEALDHLDPTLRQMGGPKLAAGIGSAQKKTAAKGELKGVSADNSKVDGDYATVVVRETFTKSPDQINTMKMRKVDGTWFVTM